MSRKTMQRAGLALSVLLSTLILAPAAAQAATFTVTNSNGGATDNVCDADCSLTDAVDRANANTEGDTIVFATNVTGEIALTVALPPLGTANGPVTVRGPGSGALKIEGGQPTFSGSGAGRIEGLTLTGGTGADRDLTLADVRISDVTVSGPAVIGGLISAGNLTLIDSKISNVAIPDGVAVIGGLFNTIGDLVLVRSQITGTSMPRGTAVIGGIAQTNGSITLTDSELADNTIGNSSTTTAVIGGLLDAAGDVSMTRSTIRSATISGGATVGGVVSASGNLAVTDSSIRDTTITDLNGPGAIVGGVASSRGLALLRSDVAGTRVSNADGSIAGGAMNAGGASSITDSSIRDTRTGARDAQGIGLNVSAGLTVERSTISGNVLEGTPTNPTVLGGGVYVPGTGRDVAIRNSTISGNSSTRGGGLAFGGGQTPANSLVLENTTVAGNSARESGGGIALIDNPLPAGQAAKLTSSIVADNEAPAGKDLATAQGQSFDTALDLIESTDGATLNAVPGKPTISGQDPQLGALGDNGGRTQTQLPSASSPAIDAGAADGLSTDQRGSARIVDLAPANASDGTDIGAVERPAPAPVPPAAVQQPVAPSSVPAACSRRQLTLLDARVRGSKVRLTGLVGAGLYGKKVAIQTDPKGARASGFARSTTVTASKTTGQFTATVPRPERGDYVTVRYRAAVGGLRSKALKLPQSLTSRSVRSANGKITVRGTVKRSLLGKRNKVTIRRLVCGRYRTVGSARPDAKGRYTVTFASSQIRGVSLYRAESNVLLRPGSKRYVTQYARAISIRTTGQTG